MSLATFKGSTLAEAADSPKYVFGEKGTRTNVYTGTWSAVVGAIVPRGTLSSGWICVSSRADKMPGEQGRLTVEWEQTSISGGTQLPPDAWNFERIDLSPHLARHPKFVTLTAAEIEIVENAIKAADALARGKWAAGVSGTPQENYLRLRQNGTETYYASGLRYVWTSHHIVLPALSTGGSIETPYGPGWPVAAGLGWSWLRETDIPSGSNQGISVTRSWMGAPGGHWDAYLYA